VIDWLYDYARELRHQPKKGLYLGTVHSAKGLEFRHVVVLDGGWPTLPDTLNEERRLYYVGMTRAEQTLTLCEFAGGNPFSPHLADAVLTQAFAAPYLPSLEQRYLQLSLKDIYLDHAGRQRPDAPIHSATAALQVGDELALLAKDDRYLIVTPQGVTVGCTSRSFTLNLRVERCEVAGIVVRHSDYCEESYRAAHKCSQWEVLVPRIIGRPLRG